MIYSLNDLYFRSVFFVLLTVGAVTATPVVAESDNPWVVGFGVNAVDFRINTLTAGSEKLFSLKDEERTKVLAELIVDHVRKNDGPKISVEVVHKQLKQQKCCSLDGNRKIMIELPK